MTNSTKIQLLQQQPPEKCCLVDYYCKLLDEVGEIKYNYGDYMTTNPINCDEELTRLPTANFELCCAFLTMLFREDYFMQYGCFECRCEKGDVQKIIDRMVILLKEME